MNTAPQMPTHTDSASAARVSTRSHSAAAGSPRRTASASAAGTDANSRKRGPQVSPPYQAYQGEYTSTSPARNSSHQTCSRRGSGSRATPSSSPGAKNSSPLPNDSTSDIRPKRNG